MNQRYHIGYYCIGSGQEWDDVIADLQALRFFFHLSPQYKCFFTLESYICFDTKLHRVELELSGTASYSMKPEA